jgi:hypothetical protein
MMILPLVLIVPAAKLTANRPPVASRPRPAGLDSDYCGLQLRL